MLREQGTDVSHAQRQRSVRRDGLRSYPGAILLTAVMLSSSLIDIPRRVPAGPTTGLGILTLLLIGTTILLLMARPRMTRGALSDLLALLPFGAWVLLSSLIHPPTMLGLQVIAVLVLFSGLIVLTTREAEALPWLNNRLIQTLKFSTGVALALCVLGLALGTLKQGLPIGPRPFTIFILLGLSLYLALWRDGGGRNRIYAFLILLCIAATLSRLGFAIAFLLTVASQWHATRVRSWLKIATMGVIGTVAVVYAVNNVPALHDRVFGENPTITVGRYQLNSSGRTRVWSIAWESYRKAPLIGQGGGSTRDLVREATSEDHPLDQVLSDFLRILHDYGALGLGLWIYGWSRLLCLSWSRHRTHGGVLPLAATLASVATVLSMTTDNVVSYAFVMAPLAILRGLAANQEPGRSVVVH